MNQYPNPKSQILITEKNTEYYYTITKDIRNVKPLELEQLEYIKTLPTENQYNIICLYNNCITIVLKMIEELQ